MQPFLVARDSPLLYVLNLAMDASEAGFRETQQVILYQIHPNSTTALFLFCFRSSSQPVALAQGILPKQVGVQLHTFHIFKQGR